MYKVFFKDSYFLLTDKQNFPETQSHLWIHEDIHSTQTFILNLLYQQNPFYATLYCKDLEELFSVFKSCFFFVRAAGGIVLQKNQILKIYLNCLKKKFILIFKTFFTLSVCGWKFAWKVFKSYLSGLSTIFIRSICFILDWTIFAFVALYLNRSINLVNLWISSLWYSWSFNCFW